MDNLQLANIDAETAVLTTILMDSVAANRARAQLSHHAFTVNTHQEIFKAAMRLSSQGIVPDIISIQNALTEPQLKALGGRDYLHSLVSDAALPLERFTQTTALLSQKQQQRELMQLAEVVRAGVLDNISTEELIGKVRTISREISDLGTQDSGPESIGEISRRVFERSSDNRTLIEQGGAPIKISTGYVTLDRMIQGIQPKRLTIVGARPSMGKTALMLAIALKVALQGFGVYLASIEMGSEQVVKRMIGSWLSLKTAAISNGIMSAEKWQEFEGLLLMFDSLPIYISDSSSIEDPSKFGLDIEKINASNPHEPVALAMVDYLQLIGDLSKSRNVVQQLGSYSKKLKRIAKEFGVDVWALAQLNRGVESRNDKRPTMSDLDGSGAIEQDADLIMMLYRSDYYADACDQQSPTGEDPEDVEILVKKQREGPVGSVTLEYIRAYNLFGDAPPRQRQATVTPSAQAKPAIDSNRGISSQRETPVKAEPPESTEDKTSLRPTKEASEIPF